MDPGLPGRLVEEHRALDALFGRFLAADSIAAFDGELRRHTALEEDRLLPAPAAGGLAAPAAECAAERLSRELRLEHVQVREISAMIRRLLEERRDVAGALRLAGNLARRWDAHTEREERELFPPR